METSIEYPTNLLSLARYIGSKKPEKLVLSSLPKMHGIYREALRGFRAVGLEVVQVKNPLSFLAKSLRRPLFFFSVNGTGLIGNPSLQAFLEATCIDTVIWFVDHPTYILKEKPVISRNALILCWDRGYTKRLKELGYQRVFHLPLATDPNIFTPRKVTKTYSFSFVGTSLLDPIRRVLKATPKGWRKAVLKKARQGARRLLSGKPLDRTVKKEVYPFYEALSLWIASRWKRVDYLKNVKDLVVFGDPDWKKLLPRAHAKPPCLYYSELPEVFGKTKVNININNLQVITSVNQRVFDCPSSGGFLLTEWSEDLDELFSGEYPSFREKEEFRDKLKYYQAKELERIKTVERIRGIVLSKHTYLHRALEILHIMIRSA